MINMIKYVINDKDTIEYMINIKEMINMIYDKFDNMYDKYDKYDLYDIYIYEKLELNYFPWIKFTYGKKVTILKIKPTP